MKRLPEAEHNQNNGLLVSKEVLMSNIIFFHAGKIPDTEVSCIWDDARLDVDAVCAFEDHVCEIRCGSSAKQTAQDVALEGVDQLCFSHPSCPTHKELGSVQRGSPHLCNAYY